MGLLDEAIREHLDLKRRRGADPAEIERAEREALGPVRREPVPAMPMDAYELAAERGHLDAPDAHERSEPAEPVRPHKRRGLFGRSRREPEVGDLHELEPERESHHRNGDFDSAAEQALRAPAAEQPRSLAHDEEPELPATSVYERPREPDDGSPQVHNDPRDDDPGLSSRHQAAQPAASLDDQSDGTPPPVAAPRGNAPPPEDTLLDTAEFDVEGSMSAPPEDSPPPLPEAGDVLEETPEFLQDTPDHDRLWFEQRPPRDFDFDG